MIKKDEHPKEPEQRTGEERRQNVRIKKNFLLSYFDPQYPDQKIEITQLKNISLGGMSFVTTHSYEPSTTLRIELKTPYIVGSVYLEGSVLQSHEKMKGTIFETRLQFKSLGTEAMVSLEKLMEYFANEENGNHE